MTDSTIKVVVAKFGCIGAAPLLDLILDERASRKDITVRAFTSGAKLDPDSCATVMVDVLAANPQLVLLVSPNATLPGSTAARDTLAERGIPAIVISDGPSRKAFLVKGDNGQTVENLPDSQGFIILPCDAMIGARKEFLDPAEMTMFNADIIKVLSATGAVRLMQDLLDPVVSALKSGAAPALPRVVATAELIVENAHFSNPYAAAKAIAALSMAESVSRLTTKACFKERDPVRRVLQAAAGHELMRAAAVLADEAREMEKKNDTVARAPHTPDGETQLRTKLL